MQKELHVTALEECARQYGSQTKLKEVARTMIECMGKRARNIKSGTYVNAVYSLGGGTWKTADLNIRSVLKAPNDPQAFLPGILQDPGEQLGPLVTPMPPLEGTDNSDDNIVVDLSQPISIPDNIDTINVPGVATVAVPKAVPDLSPKAAVLQVSASTRKYSVTNTNK